MWQKIAGEPKKSQILSRRVACTKHLLVGVGGVLDYNAVGGKDASLMEERRVLTSGYVWEQILIHWGPIPGKHMQQTLS